MIVRMMRADDARVIVDLAQALAGEVNDPRPSITATDFLAAGADGWFDCFVAEIGGSLVGYAIVCRAYEAHTGKRRLWIADLFVRGGARRSGVGRGLMSALARHAVNLGCSALSWELWRPNASGRAFYLGIGAEESGELVVICLKDQRLASLAKDNGV